MPVLLEYEAKRLLSASDVAVPSGQVVHKGDEATPVLLPSVLKSQVPAGGRGKAGGIVVVRDTPEFETARERLYHLPIKGHTPSSLLAEELLAIDTEFYLSLLIDRTRSALVFMANTHGGVEVEDNDAASFLVLNIDDFEGQSHIDFDQIGQKLADYFGLADKTFALQELARHLYECFIKNDATLIEINPLILTKSGKLAAGDCKMTLDDAAAFRHKDWDYETPLHNANFVTLDPDGLVATIANGAGLAMATVDSVSAAGLRPANFLDIGGGANEASVTRAFEEIIKYPHVRAIIINIFAGITRCDEVAKAIIAARMNISALPPLLIRLEGTNFEEAKRLLDAEHIPLELSLEACLAAAKELAA